MFCSVSKVHIGKGTWWLPTTRSVALGSFLFPHTRRTAKEPRIQVPSIQVSSIQVPSL